VNYNDYNKYAPRSLVTLHLVNQFATSFIRR